MVGELRMADWNPFDNAKPTAATDFLAAWQKGRETASANDDAMRMRNARSTALQALQNGDSSKAAMLLGIAGDDKSAQAVGAIAHNQAGDSDNYAKSVAGSVANVLNDVRQKGGKPEDVQAAFDGLKPALLHVHGIDPNIVNNFNPNDPTHVAWLHAQAGYGYSPHDQASDATAQQNSNTEQFRSRHWTAGGTTGIYSNDGLSATPLYREPKTTFGAEGAYATDPGIGNGPVSTSAGTTSDAGSGGGLTSVIANIESGNKDYKPDGITPMTSKAGAKYAMQVMPATARDPGFGITPAASDTPEEYNRVGRELITKLSDRYQGDPLKIAAAYHSGAGNVDKAIAAGGTDWVSHLGPRGRDYVAKTMAGLGGDGSGTKEASNTPLVASGTTSPSATTTFSGGYQVHPGTPKPTTQWTPDGKGFLHNSNGDIKADKSFVTGPLGDASKSGNEYLATLKPDDQQMVKGIIAGRYQLGTRPSDSQRALFAAASRVDPTVDMTTYQMRVTTIKEYAKTSVTTAGGQITAIKTFLHHTADLIEASDGIGGSDTGLTPLDRGLNSLSQNMHATKAINQFNTAKGPVARELEKITRGSGGTLAGIEELLKNINPSDPPSMRRDKIQEITRLVLGRLDPLVDGYNRGTGRDMNRSYFLSPYEQRVADQIARGQPVTHQDMTVDPNKHVSRPTSNSSVSVPHGAADMLRKNPSLRAQFDAKYGAGASSHVLGH